MNDQPENKTISLATSWKNHIIGYTVSILLIPVFLVGLIGLYWVRKRQKRVSYEVSDSKITSRDSKYERNVDLVNIEKVHLQQSWIQQKMNVGDLQLFTSASSITLFGMENPQTLKRLIERAVAVEKHQLREQEQTKPREPKYPAGTMDRLDYLTGLWQQGLVSDEDYEKERKHFE
ncbi:MAG TPA: PH domain-containing protein [Balneolaceae bacterium]|nr:PH domain-containing protein [Balneolaceae bacterium]